MQYVRPALSNFHPNKVEKKYNKLKMKKSISGVT